MRKVSTHKNSYTKLLAPSHPTVVFHLVCTTCSLSQLIVWPEKEAYFRHGWYTIIKYCFLNHFGRYFMHCLCPKPALRMDQNLLQSEKGSWREIMTCKCRTTVGLTGKWRKVVNGTTPCSKRNTNIANQNNLLTGKSQNHNRTLINMA